MMRKKIAPAGAFAAAALMSLSITGLADGEYILLLPASSEISYEVDEAHKSEDYSSGEYTVLLYQPGETVELKVETDREYSIQDAQTAMSIADYTAADDGSVTFSMPEADLCLIMGDVIESEAEYADAGSEADAESETEPAAEPAGAVDASGEAGIQLVLNGDCTAEVTMVGGEKKDLEENGILETEDKVDIFYVNSPSGFDKDPDISVWKDGEPVEDASGIIINTGHSGNTYIVDMKNSMALDGLYTVQFTMDGYTPREVALEGIPGEEEEEWNGTMQIMLFDDLKGEAESASGNATEIARGAVESISEKAKTVTVTGDGGIPSDVDVEAYLDGEEIDAESIIEGMQATKEGYAITFKEDLDPDGNYRLIITPSEGSEELNADDIEEAEPVAEEAEAEPETEETEAAEQEEPAEGGTETEAETEAETERKSIVSIEGNDVNGSISEGKPYTFSLDIADGYGETDDFAVRANGEALEANEDGTYTIDHVSENQDITIEGIADIEGPKITAELNGEAIQPEDGICIKSGNSISVSAEDAGSGVEGIKYAVLAQQADPASIWSWTDYNEPFVLDAAGTVYVYVAAEDGEGNASYLSLENIAVYEDSEFNEADENYKKGSGADFTADIKRNGNEVGDVSIDGSVLARDQDYTEANGTIHFTASFMESLETGSHQAEAAVKPAGTDYALGDAPEAVQFTISVIGEEASLTDISDISKEYDGTPVGAPSYQTNSNADAVIEYKKSDEGDDAYAGEAPKSAGSYDVRITILENGDYGGIADTASFTISPKSLTISPVNQSILAGEDIDKGTDAVECSGLLEGDVLSSVSITDNERMLEADNAVIVNAEGADVTGNYDVSYGTAELTVEPVVQDPPEGLMPQAETVAGLADGKIAGLTTDMEYSTDGENYEPVEDPDMGFEGGTYYVRYAADGTREASEPVEAEVEAGHMLSVVFLIDSDIAEVKEVKYGESIPESEIPEIVIEDGYTPSDAHWDVDSFENITSDVVAHAVYTIGEYSISFSSNDDAITIEQNAKQAEQGLSIDLQCDAEIEVRSADDEIIEDADKVFTEEDHVKVIIVTMPDGSEPEIVLTKDGEELEEEDMPEIEKKDDGAYEIAFEDGMEFDGEYILTIS